MCNVYYWSFNLIYLWAQQMTNIWVRYGAVRCLHLRNPMSEIFLNESHYQRYTQNPFGSFFSMKRVAHPKNMRPRICNKNEIDSNHWTGLDWAGIKYDHQYLRKHLPILLFYSVLEFNCLSTWMFHKFVVFFYENRRFLYAQLVSITMWKGVQQQQKCENK